MTLWNLHILEKPEEMRLVEELQRRVWPGNETEIVPAHVLLAVAHNGGLVVGAFSQEQPREQASNHDPEETEAGSSPDEAKLVGFVFSFPGIYDTADGARLKHHSHMLGVDPAYRDQGIGFALKRAQWQMTRHQGVDRITWTYDPLLSRNAYLNISRLGAVCNTYLRDEYGELRDGLNTGISTDRFQVDWWVNTNRVNRRLSKRPRLRLDLAHFLAAGTQIINASQIGQNQLVVPAVLRMEELTSEIENAAEQPPMFLVEIPANFHWIKAADLELAQSWRMHTRELFESLFSLGYLVTDFVYLPGALPRSFYVLSYGQSSL
jgi:predicted GNAT superfamily acetyltransferase